MCEEGVDGESFVWLTPLDLLRTFISSEQQGPQKCEPFAHHGRSHAGDTKAGRKFASHGAPPAKSTSTTGPREISVFRADSVVFREIAVICSSLRKKSLMEHGHVRNHEEVCSAVRHLQEFL